MPIPRIEGEPSPIMALGAFGAVIGAALSALFTGVGVRLRGHNHRRKCWRLLRHDAGLPDPEKAL